MNKSMTTIVYYCYIKQWNLASMDRIEDKNNDRYYNQDMNLGQQNFTHMVLELI